MLRLGAQVWPPPLQPRLPVEVTGVNTAILLLSGATMALALRAIGRGNQAGLPRYLGRFLALGFFGAAATIFGSLGYVRSVAAYVEAVKQVEIPVTLAVGVIFFNERERVQAIWPGCIILMLGLFILIFAS